MVNIREYREKGNGNKFTLYLHSSSLPVSTHTPSTVLRCHILVSQVYVSRLWSWRAAGQCLWGAALADSSSQPTVGHGWPPQPRGGFSGKTGFRKDTGSKKWMGKTKCEKQSAVTKVRRMSSSAESQISLRQRKFILKDSGPWITHTAAGKNLKRKEHQKRAVVYQPTPPFPILLHLLEKRKLVVLVFLHSSTSNSMLI